MLSRCFASFESSSARTALADRGMFSQKFLITAITQVYGIYLNEIRVRQESVCRDRYPSATRFGWPDVVRRKLWKRKRPSDSSTWQRRLFASAARMSR